MLAKQFGKLIKNERKRKGLKQEELARRAQVSRAVLSRLEQQKSQPVRSDTVDRLFEVLEVKPPAFDEKWDRDGARKLARLEQQLRLGEQRERHLRLAIELNNDESGAVAKVARARERVELWRKNKSCSPFYIERWSEILSQPPQQMAKEMSSLGEWENALFQNSPWSWAWR